MFRNLLKRSRPEPLVASVPAGVRAYAVGDIHGALPLLDRLLEAIARDGAARGGEADTQLIFLGDLVDRGPDSAGVVERLLALRAADPSVRFIKGNHEEIFLTAAAGDERAAKLFCRVGGRETMLSYGLSPEGYDRMDYAEVVAWLAANVPPEHVAFLDAFEDMVTLGSYVFVHAGIDPSRPLDDQRGADLRWIREPFLGHDGHVGAMVVHGHTICEAVEYRPHRIGIDTGAYQSGRLTALGLEGDRVWEVAT